MGKPAEAKTTARVFSEMDADGDGTIDRNEFLDLPPELQSASNRENIMAYHRELFDMADVDGDGTLQENEFHFASLLSHKSWRENLDNLLGEDPGGASLFADGADAAEENLRMHDLNGDRKIDREEYDEGMRRFASRLGWLREFDDPDITQWREATWAAADITGDGALQLREVRYLTELCDLAVDAGILYELAIRHLVFEAFDVDGDEKIQLAEVARRLEDLDRLHETWFDRMRQDSAGETAAESKAEPTDESATVPLEEKLHFLGSYWGMRVVELLRTRFGEVDADGDDALDKQEARQLLTIAFDGS